MDYISNPPPCEEDVKDKVESLPRVDTDLEVESHYAEVSFVDKPGADNDDEHGLQSAKVSSIDEFGVDNDGEHECKSLKVSSDDNCEMDVDGERDCQGPRLLSIEECGKDLDGKQVQNPKVASVGLTGYDISIKDEPDEYVEPKVGVEFGSEELAYKCYQRYAVMEGFSIRKDFVNKSRINGAVVSRRYTCFRQGHRPSKHEANVRKPRQETRTGCLAHMTIARQPNGNFRVTHFETRHNHELVTPTTAYMLPSHKRLTFAQAVEANSSNSSVTDGVPRLGMGFDSEDLAYEFYNAYAGRVGFSVRKDYVNRSKIDGAVASRRYTCFREGFRQKDKRDLNVKRPRKETRIGCLAQLVIARQPDGKYRVTHFEEKHNHELVAACRVRMLRSQKRSAVGQVVEANIVDGSKIHPKSLSELMCKPAGGQENLGYDPIDHKSNLPSKRTREMRNGEPRDILKYFQSKQLKDPSFFHSIQLDAEEQITNVFWADAKMVVDYSDFGDVVCFDTTYKLKDCRPFAPFFGVNNHKQMVIFGAALLYDNTVESFKWLLRTFIEAMSGKKPKTILTDQDAVMAEAIEAVLPETHHRICVWHVYQNALTYISDIFLAFESFSNDFCSCIFYHEEEEDFINAWKVMLDTYGLWENEWLNEIFKAREKWSIAYGKHIFCADIKTVQLCDGFHTNLRKYLKSDLDVLQFFKHLGRVVNDWRYKELEANYDMSQHMPRLMGDVILLKHARDIYTPSIFELFQLEYEKCLNVVVSHCTESGSLFKYKVGTYGHLQEYIVVFNSSDNRVVCNCMKFESMGVLCSHALKVLDYRNIKVLPKQYVLKRWTREARV